MAEEATRCAVCGGALPPRARFCPDCGRPQSGDSHTLTELSPDPVPSRLEPTTARDDALPRRLLAPGTRLGPVYTVDSVIGEGGMGIVYRGVDHARGRDVAIKALHASLMGDAGIRKRFTREAKVMTTWTHANVVQVFDLVELDELLAFVMEYIDGPTLETYLDKWGGQMPLSDVRMVFTAVLDAMTAAHARGIVHRDLKPQNILLRLDEDGLHPKVVDFGIAKVLDGTAYTVTGALLGSCRYMSPEQVKALQSLDHRSDIYSLGVSLYRAVAGRCPFESDNHFSLMMAHVNQKPEPPSHYRRDLPDALETLILDALAKDPEDRPASCADFRRQLDAALRDVTPVRARVPPKQLAPIIVEEDGSELVLIPGGAFQQGPARREVFVDPFYIARHPVTNRQFQRFIEITGYRPRDAEAGRFLAHWRGRKRCPPALLDHPVVFVSWVDTHAFCRWAGRRLPTEAEWEKAARGTDGRKYPWGRTAPTNELANFARAAGGTTPVQAHPEGASPYGIEDLAGNVAEWCEDVDDAAFYLRGPERNPRNTVRAGDDPCVVRGGSWMYDKKAMRTFARTSHPPTFRLAGLGFRCAY